MDESMKGTSEWARVPTAFLAGILTLVIDKSSGPHGPMKLAYSEVGALRELSKRVNEWVFPKGSGIVK